MLINSIIVKFFVSIALFVPYKNKKKGFVATCGNL